jgi:DNA-binding NtrC family response regulator
VSKNANILIVDDDAGVTDLLSAGLEENEGYHCFAVATGEHALEKLSSSNIDVMLLDLRLPGISGIDVLTKAKMTHPDTLVIVITGVGDVQTAVEAMKLGATDYITKPFDVPTIASSIESALREETGVGSKLYPEDYRYNVSDETSRWAACMDSIARGVEMRLESLLGTTITQTVVDRTVATAQSMGIPESHISQWLNSRK